MFHFLNNKSRNAKVNQIFVCAFRKTFLKIKMTMHSKRMEHTVIPLFTNAAVRKAKELDVTLWLQKQVRDKGNALSAATAATC